MALFLQKICPVRGHGNRCCAARPVCHHIEFLSVAGNCIEASCWMRVEVKQELRLFAPEVIGGKTNCRSHQSVKRGISKKQFLAITSPKRMRASSIGYLPLSP